MNKFVLRAQMWCAACDLTVPVRIRAGTSGFPLYDLDFRVIAADAQALRGQGWMCFIHDGWFCPTCAPRVPALPDLPTSSGGER